MQGRGAVERQLLLEQGVAELAASLIMPDELCCVAIRAHALQEERPIFHAPPRLRPSPPVHIVLQHDLGVRCGIGRAIRRRRSGARERGGGGGG
jgi:hypothetical protein